MHQIGWASQLGSSLNWKFNFAFPLRLVHYFSALPETCKGFLAARQHLKKMFKHVQG